MDQTVRNKLRGVVTQCRKLLEDATSQALQGRFGIFAARKKGEVQIEDDTRMSHLTDEDRACRRDLLDHLAHIQAIGYKPSEALEQLVREIAFTHLNRLCAYKMMESRGLIREAVSRGLKSQGFFFYLADHPEAEKLHNRGQQDIAYRNFLDWLGGTLSEEIGVLFNPNDPANRIYPPQRVMDEVLALINDGELKDIWSQDETIGWIYQYFTPKELRDNARKESQAPRNSYELAFRNQFFTPRYVVEFLTDNTLGRIWYEMRKGKTTLKDRCKYLVRRPTEVFLKDGELPPGDSNKDREDISQEELLKQPVCISHRPKKDPRELKVLDPACGSGHFLLYCFDLFQIIYEEVYDDPDLSAALRSDYPAIDDLRRAIPGLILRHNLYGIDIDLRASQIAALALWLRCQRAYKELGLKNGERPKITRSNLVCAEPMPGETDLLKEFAATLQPKVLGQLVETVFEKMKLAGEAGSLLKIEEEIREAASKAKFDYIQWKKHQDKAKWSLFPDLVARDQPSIFDFTDMTDEVFLDRAEDEIVGSLRQYAEKASNGKGFRRRLFAEDAARGFSFIDVCNKKYDVVLMNPPFGTATERSLRYLTPKYGTPCKDLAASFVVRANGFCNEGGTTGAISTRTLFFLSAFSDWRQTQLLQEYKITTFADLGMGVLDAVVETVCYTIACGQKNEICTFFDCSAKDSVWDFGLTLLNKIEYPSPLIMISHEELSSLPDHIFSYKAPTEIRTCYTLLPPYEEIAGVVKQGLGTSDDFRFVRAFWEVPILGNRWFWYGKGGSSEGFYSDIHLLVNFANQGEELWENKSEKGNVRSNIWMLKETIKNYFFRAGLTFTYRSRLFAPEVLPAGCIFGVTGMTIFPNDSSKNGMLLHLGLFNSAVLNYLILSTCERFEPLFQASKINRTPWKIVRNEEQIVSESIQIIKIKQSVMRHEETSALFLFPYFWIESSLNQTAKKNRQNISTGRQQLARKIGIIDEAAYKLYGISEYARKHIDEDVGYRRASFVEPDNDRNAVNRQYTREIISYCLGCILCRWDIRFAIGELNPPEIPDPFDPLPVCPPGMLQGPDGLPAKPEDIMFDYPIRIDWNGILVDDSGHEDDIVRRVREVLEVIWKNRAEDIEQEACEIFGVREMRDYFRKPGNGGFWMDHVKRYSKSRRKAPIYWYLRSTKGNYGLWLYYHRLDKDILFKALLNYVEPKIRLEGDRLKSLRSRKEAAGSSGHEAKQIEKDIDRQDLFVSELYDFADKLRRAANLRLEPDLNDGVVLTIAPLFELVPWKEAKDYWEDLVAGKYEWSSIGRQMREKGLVK